MSMGFKGFTLLLASFVFFHNLHSSNASCENAYDQARMRTLEQKANSISKHSDGFGATALACTTGGIIACFIPGGFIAGLPMIISGVALSAVSSSLSPNNSSEYRTYELGFFPVAYQALQDAHLSHYSETEMSDTTRSLLAVINEIRTDSGLSPLSSETLLNHINDLDNKDQLCVNRKDGPLKGALGGKRYKKALDYRTFTLMVTALNQKELEHLMNRDIYIELGISNGSEIERIRVLLNDRTEMVYHGKLLDRLYSTQDSKNSRFNALKQRLFYKSKKTSSEGGQGQSYDPEATPLISNNS